MLISGPCSVEMLARCFLSEEEFLQRFDLVHAPRSDFISSMVKSVLGKAR
jgi:hypothetical protein